MNVKRLVALLSLCLLAAAPQPKPNIPSMGETIEVTVVNVELFVTDNKGQRVRGLTANDFDVFEEGVRQPISNFAEYSETVQGGQAGVPVPQKPGEAGASLPQKDVAVDQAPPQPRTIVLFYEPTKLPNFRIEPLFASLKQLVRDSVRPGDAMAIVVWNGVAGMIERQPFTDDVNRLEAVLDDLAEESVGVRLDPYSEARRRSIELALLAQSIADVAGARGAPALAGGSAGAASQFDARGNAWMAMLEQRAKIRGINALMNGISGSGGKKALLLATRRLGDFAGAEYFFATGSGEVPFDRRTELDMRSELNSMTETANANGVTIYPLYFEGLGNEQGADASISPAGIQGTSPTGILPANFDYLVLNNETGALSTLAERTGGLMAWGSKNIVNLIPHVQDDFDSYYSLGYRTQTRREDRARKIVVKAKNPAYTVRARRQFVEKSDTTKMKERLIASLFRETGEWPIFDIKAELGAPKQVKKDRRSFPLTITIPVESLTTLEQNGQQAGAFSVFVVPGKVLGAIGEVTQKTQSYTIKPEDLEKTKLGVFTYELEVLVDPATQKLAIAVYDEVSRDYGLVQLEVPR